MMMRVILLCIILTGPGGVSSLFGGVLYPGQGCSICPPGYGATQQCDTMAYIDTKCEECPNGTFNEQYNSERGCTPCLQCGHMHYAMRPCSRIKDTACLPCWDKNDGAAYGNEDYLKQCESQNPPTPSAAPELTTADLGSDTVPGVKPPPIGLPSLKTTAVKPTTVKLTTTTTTTTTTIPTTTTPLTKPATLKTTTVKELLLTSDEQTTVLPITTANNSILVLGAPDSREVSQASTNWAVLIAVLVAAGVVIIALICTVVICKRKTKKKERLYRVQSRSRVNDPEKHGSRNFYNDNQDGFQHDANGYHNNYDGYVDNDVGKSSIDAADYIIQPDDVTIPLHPVPPVTVPSGQPVSTTPLLSSLRSDSLKPTPSMKSSSPPQTPPQTGHSVTGQTTPPSVTGQATPLSQEAPYSQGSRPQAPPPLPPQPQPSPGLTTGMAPRLVTPLSGAPVLSQIGTPVLMRNPEPSSTEEDPHTQILSPQTMTAPSETTGPPSRTDSPTAKKHAKERGSKKKSKIEPEFNPDTPPNDLTEPEGIPKKKSSRRVRGKKQAKKELSPNASSQKPPDQSQISGRESPQASPLLNDKSNSSVFNESPRSASPTSAPVSPSESSPEPLIQPVKCEQVTPQGQQPSTSPTEPAPSTPKPRTPKLTPLPRSTPIASHTPSSQKPLRKHGRLRRHHGSFNRNLNYIDEHSDDEVATNMGRPPSVVYKDTFGQMLRRQFSDLWGRIRRRSRRSSAASDRSFCEQSSFDYSRGDDTMQDVSFDLNSTGMSLDYHNLTNTSFDYHPVTPRTELQQSQSDTEALKPTDSTQPQSTDVQTHILDNNQESNKVTDQQSKTPKVHQTESNKQSEVVLNPYQDDSEQSNNFPFNQKNSQSGNQTAHVIKQPSRDESIPQKDKSIPEKALSNDQKIKPIGSHPERSTGPKNQQPRRSSERQPRNSSLSYDDMTRQQDLPKHTQHQQPEKSTGPGNQQPRRSSEQKPQNSSVSNDYMTGQEDLSKHTQHQQLSENQSPQDSTRQQQSQSGDGKPRVLPRNKSIPKSNSNLAVNSDKTEPENQSVSQPSASRLQTQPTNITGQPAMDIGSRLLGNIRPVTRATPRTNDTEPTPRTGQQPALRKDDKSQVRSERNQQQTGGQNLQRPISRAQSKSPSRTSSQPVMAIPAKRPGKSPTRSSSQPIIESQPPSRSNLPQPIEMTETGLPSRNKIPLSRKQSPTRSSQQQQVGDNGDKLQRGSSQEHLVSRQSHQLLTGTGLPQPIGRQEDKSPPRGSHGQVLRRPESQSPSRVQQPVMRPKSQVPTGPAVQKSTVPQTTKSDPQKPPTRQKSQSPSRKDPQKPPTRQKSQSSSRRVPQQTPTRQKSQSPSRRVPQPTPTRQKSQSPSRSGKQQVVIRQKKQAPTGKSQQQAVGRPKSQSPSRTNSKQSINSQSPSRAESRQSIDKLDNKQTNVSSGHPHPMNISGNQPITAGQHRASNPGDIQMMAPLDKPQSRPSDTQIPSSHTEPQYTKTRPVKKRPISAPNYPASGPPQQRRNLGRIQSGSDLDQQNPRSRLGHVELYDTEV